MATVKLDPAKGIQIPNLTTTERNAISSPETGAIIWNTTTSEINQYNGSAWEITYTDTSVAGITSSADATAITINSSENVGSGVVPEVTHPTHDALQVGGNGVWTSYGTQGASGEMDFQHNAYFAASGNDQYISTDEATKYRQGGGTHRFYTAPSGSADAAITWTQRARIDSDGLKFNNDSAAANALDDYEEGTWTPTISGNSTCSMSTIHNSHYTKVGSVVQLYTSFNVTSSAVPATGALVFGGFPFAFKTLGESAFLITVYYNYRETPMCFMNKNGNVYYQNTTVGGNNLGDLTAALHANQTFGMTFSYLTDA